MKFFVPLVLLFTLVSTPAFALDRSKIAESAEEVTPLLNGQTIPDVTLKTPEGDPVSLRALTMQKPSVILFYRGGWCPYCNRQLAGMRDVEEKLLAMGYQVLAISPDSPKRLQEQKLETEFAVTLLSDEKLEAIRGFGIGFYLSTATELLYETKMGLSLAEDEATERAVLPAPAVFLVNQKGLITFNYVNPNFKVRPSPELIYQAAQLSE